METVRRVRSSPVHQSQNNKYNPYQDEESLVNLLVRGSPSDQEVALISLRQATRSNNPDLRIALCDSNLLSSLRSMVLSSNTRLQANALAIIVNLSLEPTNRTRIVKSGMLNILVGPLKTAANSEVKSLAVAAVYSLSTEEKNSKTIGALGAIPPLVEIFVKGDQEGHVAQHEAGKTIYYLTLSADNRGRVIRTDSAVRRIVRLVKREDGDKRRVGMVIVCNLARCENGRTALLEAKSVAVLVELLKAEMESSSMNKSNVERRFDQREIGKEDLGFLVVSALYGMSKGTSSRFRGMARLVKAEEVLIRVIEERNGAMREMARRTLKAIRGEEDEYD